MTASRTGTARRQWRSTRAARVWIVSAVALVAVAVWLTFVTALEVGEIRRFRLPTPPEVARDVLVRDVADAAGRKASFRILLFSDEFRWRLSSFDALEASPARPHFTDEMKAVLNAAEEIITVGASSEELPAGVPATEGRALEERRAGRRAERIALWVREALVRPIPVRKLNVGHHAPTRSTRGADTSDQRRVVIILVLDYDEGVDVDQALRAAMARESLRAPIFEALLTRYSLSAGGDFTWVP